VTQIHATHVFCGKGAPIILAGTRKDQVSVALKGLSDRLLVELQRRCESALIGLIANRGGPSTPEDGVEDLCFFAIENSRGYKGDESIRNLVRALELASNKLPSMSQLVPLLWLRVYDELRRLSRGCEEGVIQRHVTLDAVRQLAVDCGMPHPGLTIEDELPVMLHFFHDLNAVLWWDTEKLRDLVILDAQWIIDAATCIIRDFKLPDHTDRYERMRQYDQQAIREEPHAWTELIEGKAMLHHRLLDILWQHPDFESCKQELLDLMIKFSLAVPVPGKSEQFIIPSLLRESVPESPPIGWPPPCDDALHLRLHFSFKGNETKDVMKFSYDDSELAHGCLPIGAFYKLCAGALGSSYRTSSGSQLALYRNFAFVVLNQIQKEHVILEYVPAKSSVIARLSSNAQSGSGGIVLDRLRVLISEELSTYGNLRCRILTDTCASGSISTLLSRLSERRPDQWVDLEAIPFAMHHACLGYERCKPELRALQRELAFWFSSSCDFNFILAENLRGASESEFPQMLRLQDMRRKFPDWIVNRRIVLTEACRGSYTEEYLAVSHRWEDANNPDLNGAQLKALNKFLKERPKIRYVFYDYMCLPQGDRTAEDKAEFYSMLPNVNLLYVGASVLILLDRTYNARFWTQFEAWLAFRSASLEGLASSCEEHCRCVIECIQGTPERYADALRGEWRNCSALHAWQALSSDSVTVTNRRDKDVMLPKILQLNEDVKRLMLMSSFQNHPKTRTVNLDSTPQVPMDEKAMVRDALLQGIVGRALSLPPVSALVDKIELDSDAPSQGMVVHQGLSGSSGPSMQEENEYLRNEVKASQLKIAALEDNLAELRKETAKNHDETSQRLEELLRLFRQRDAAPQPS
jgi:hypothetical protein